MAKAGPDKELCGAWITKREKHCERVAGAGTGHKGVGRCDKHGGASPTHEASGQLELAKQAAGLLSVPVATNPFESLLQLEAEAMGYVEYFRRKVQELDPDMVWVRPTSILRRPLDEGKEGENPNIEVEEISEAPLDLNIAIKAHRQAMEDLRKISKTVLDANVAERLTKIEEGTARVFAEAMRGLVEDLDIVIDARVLKLMQKRLTAIDSTAEEV